MQLAVDRATAIADARSLDDAPDQLLGLIIISLFPAAFWTALVAGVGTGIGHPLSPAALMTFGAAVAAFLAATGSAILWRA